uniref:Uncharacterized protein n=1 Tax=Octopus bimaculoides TaxID=37653 RepID=A0A0L8ICM8_OCTBM
MYSFVLYGIINNSLKALLCFYVFTLFDMFTNRVYSGVIHAVCICLKHSSYCLVDALNKIVLLVKMYSYIRIPTHAHRCEHITSLLLIEVISLTLMDCQREGGNPAAETVGLFCPHTWFFCFLI